jgi:hypothetical protein
LKRVTVIHVLSVGRRLQRQPESRTTGAPNRDPAHFPRTPP